MSIPARLVSRDNYNLVNFNALRSGVFKGITGTIQTVFPTNQAIYGWSLNNNDAGIRWVQIFFKPATQVIAAGGLGVVPPDKTIQLPASVNTTLELDNPILATNGFSWACTTGETNNVAVTAAVTGDLYVAIQ